MNLDNKKTKAFLTALGIVSLGLGIVGIALPVLPTTPFLLLASFLFYKSSKKLHDWLLGNKLFGQYISSYKKHRAIKRKAKIASIGLLWVTLAVSIYTVDNLYIRIFLGIVGIAVTAHLLYIKTLENIKMIDDEQTTKSD